MHVDKQLAVFLENRPGALAAMCGTLAEAGINLLALTVSDTVDHAVIRLVTDKPDKALHLLGDAGMLVVESDVLVVELTNQPGTLGQVARKLAQNNINIEYAYCTTMTDAVAAPWSCACATRRRPLGAFRTEAAPRSPRPGRNGSLMRILLTNDDGPFAPGLCPLRHALEALGEVTIVCPAEERSGVGHAITYLSPVRASTVRLHDGTAAHTLTGMPADCVKFAMLSLMDARPDLVVSGPNLGVNLGTDVFYSGTVAAALEGGFFGVPGRRPLHHPRE